MVSENDRMFRLPVITGARLVCVLAVLFLIAMLVRIVAFDAVDPPSRKYWEMAFVTEDGRALLVTVSAADLYSSVKPSTERAFQTVTSCKGAWYDAASGRLATVEGDGQAGEVVRVYDHDAVLLAEYPVDPNIIGRVCYNPCLTAGGSRVAFAGDLGVLFWAVVGGKPQGVHKLCQLSSDALDVSEWGRLGQSRLGRCYWVDDDTLAVCYRPRKGNDRIHCVDVTQDRVKFTGDGHLAGVLANRCIVAVSYWPPFLLADAESGTNLGRVTGSHAYCYFERISPCGEYVLYHEPPGGLLRREERSVIHHLKSRKQATLKFPAGWRLGSWSETNGGGRPERSDKLVR